MKDLRHNKKWIIGISALAVVAIVLLNIYFQNRPAAQGGTKSYTLEVVDDQGNEKSYSGKTDADFLVELMDELQAAGDFSYSGEKSEYGLFLTTINGVTADYDATGAYWAIYVNGDYGQYGADTQPVTDKDSYQFVYTTN